jgi:hypothetical protein
MIDKSRIHFPDGSIGLITEAADELYKNRRTVSNGIV